MVVVGVEYAVSRIVSQHVYFWFGDLCLEPLWKNIVWFVLG